MKETSALAHHDVSLENVGLSANGICKIIDFGMALHVPTTNRHHQGGGGGGEEDKEEEEEEEEEEEGEEGNRRKSSNSISRSSLMKDNKGLEKEEKMCGPIYLTPQTCCGKAAYMVNKWGEG